MQKADTDYHTILINTRNALISVINSNHPKATQLQGDVLRLSAKIVRQISAFDRIIKADAKTKPEGK